MVGTSVPVPGILSHDISYHTHLPGLSIVLGFNLQHRMGRWSQEGSVMGGDRFPGPPRTRVGLKGPGIPWNPLSS